MIKRVKVSLIEYICEQEGVEVEPTAVIKAFYLENFFLGKKCLILSEKGTTRPEDISFYEGAAAQEIYENLRKDNKEKQIDVPDTFLNWVKAIYDYRHPPEKVLKLLR